MRQRLAGTRKSSFLDPYKIMSAEAIIELRPKRIIQETGICKFLGCIARSADC
jgi:ABC-type hemin transport system substrate-binding protein